MSDDKRGFTDQKRRVATEADCAASWGGVKNGVRFRCYLCGHRFVPGDGWRWVYSAGQSQEIEGKRFGVVNPMTCDSCDGDDVLDRWVKRNEEFNSAKFWALH